MSGPWQQQAAAILNGFASSRPTPTPVTVADIQRRLGQRPNQFATDLNARARADLAGLNAAIDQVRANPTDLLNAPRVIGAVADYVPRALGLAPAAAVDQLTGPPVRAINARFGSHYDPRYVTDQLLSAAGVVAGSGGLRGLARPIAARAGTPVAGAPVVADTAVGAIPEGAGFRAAIGGAADSESAAADSPPSTEERLRALPESVVAAPDSEYAVVDRRQNQRLLDLSPDIQNHFHQFARDPMLEPITDDPDFIGYTGAHVADFSKRLSDLADHYAGQGAPGQSLAHELQEARFNFLSMASRTQPAFKSILQGEYDRFGPTGKIYSLTEHLPLSERGFGFNAGKASFQGPQDYMRASNDNEEMDVPRLIPPDGANIPPELIGENFDQRRARLRREAPAELLQAFDSAGPMLKGKIMAALRSTIPVDLSQGLPPGVASLDDWRNTAAQGADLGAGGAGDGPVNSTATASAGDPTDGSTFGAQLAARAARALTVPPFHSGGMNAFLPPAAGLFAAPIAHNDNADEQDVMWRR